MVVHVLTVESIRYAEHIASGGVSILAGCVCGRCGGKELKITNSWVDRGFQISDGEYDRIDIVLARCLNRECDARERVLPCDALPGKINSVSNIYGALAAVSHGEALTAAAERAGVSRQAVCNWIDGVACRYLDLGRLYRHRASLASGEVEPHAALVNFWAFIERARTEHHEYCWPQSVSPPEKHEAIDATAAMVELLEIAGGALEVAKVGTSLFRQAVLLFRSGGLNTSSYMFNGGGFLHGGRAPEGEHHDQEKNTGPKDAAFWRYEQIEEALPENLSSEERGKTFRRLSKTPVRWPSGKTKAIPVSTAYRWLSDYRRGGLEALRPKRRSDRGVARTKLPDAVVQEALRQLTEDPGLSLTFLLAILCPLFPKIRIPRSTLQDRLHSHPDYKRIQRLKRRTQRRTRFVARAPHDIWHTDAKGPVRVVLDSGKKLAFHILTILDDATRAVLAAIVALSPDLAAAVRVFRIAANRWGLPAQLYADRASIFDSKPFRMGLAQIGSHRIRTKPRNPEANGKIEAYHRCLVNWFTNRLPKQVVIDCVHLQQLLDGVIYSLYQPHRHRGLKQSPKDALGERVSKRVVPPTRLVDAFRQEKKLKTHPKTGEVEVSGITYIVPDELRGGRLKFLLDPPREIPPLVVHPTSKAHLLLQRAAIKPEDLDEADPRPEPHRWGSGNLQALYDNWQGKRRPIAEPGFGLPEIYALLAKACGRHVPGSDAEAALVQRVYREIGPLSQVATETAFAAIAQQLGPKRPLKTYLDELQKKALRDNNPDPPTREKP